MPRSSMSRMLVLQTGEQGASPWRGTIKILEGLVHRQVHLVGSEEPAKAGLQVRLLFPPPEFGSDADSRWPQLFAKQSIRLKPGVVGAAPTASAKIEV